MSEREVIQAVAGSSKAGIHKKHERSNTSDGKQRKKQKTKKQTNESRKKAPSLSTVNLARPKSNCKKQTWDERYAELVTFQQKHGHCNVPHHTEKSRLGSWVSIQKGPNLSKLRQDQKDRLDAIGFNWDKIGTRFDKQWNAKFQELKAYKQEHGTVLVPKLQNSTDHSLTDWVSNQRTKYQHQILRRDREEKLDAIGFVWNTNKSWCADRDVSRFEKAWQAMYDTLLDFKEANDHCLVPYDHGRIADQIYPRLGRWVQAQRTALVENKLSSKRKTKLDDVGFVWKVIVGCADSSLKQRQWDATFNLLVQFKNDNGHTLVPRGYSDQGLAGWVGYQRSLYRGGDGSLPDARAQRLIAIGFWFGRTHDKVAPDNHLHYNIMWAESFAKLRAYEQRHGHTCVPFDYKEDPHLGHWTHGQKRLNGKGKMLEERKAQLDSIGFSWKIGDALERSTHEFEKKTKPKSQPQKTS